VSRRFRPTDAFVDESVRGQRYLLGCVLIEARSLTTTRQAMGDLRHDRAIATPSAISSVTSSWRTQDL
jgi:hypothetical protein